jgi:WD40 repeat protein
VKVWDAQTGKELFTLKGHTMQVLSVAFSPDGKWIASASQDRRHRRNGRHHGPQLPR